MKILKITLALLFCFHLKLDAQKLIENEFDEFEKINIKKTSWCSLMKRPGSARPYRAEFQLCKKDTLVYLKVKMMLNNKVYSISKGDKISFLLENENVVSLYSNEYTVAGIGDGAVGYGGSANYGTETNYIITKENIKNLYSSIIKKIRIETSDGYIDEIDKRKVDLHLKKCLELVTTE
jgi:hypothetical protein